ncbi:bestrophin-like domain [Paludisphaera soli]|uniref:bestrophin-like domain n=1 Tax=Paludisphaera soli TaxID=2712865 RepID=UPI0013EB65B8|nr:hypothetical protein [Paludisphaera soli]
MNHQPLDAIPMWLFLPLALAAGLAAVESGYRFGRWRHARASEELPAPVAAMVAVLGLLALLLGFTFSLAASRFDARRQAVLEEANAIGTTFLRCRLLPEPQRTESMDRLREYADLRIRGLTEAGIAEVLARSGELHEELWSRAVAVAERNPEAITTGLYVQSLNTLIDLHAKRVMVGLRSRIPLSIWLVLFGLSTLGMASVGYQAGLSETRRSPEMPILTLGFAAVLFLIVDLDRAHEGVLRVGQQAMVDVLRSMGGPRP